MWTSGETLTAVRLEDKNDRNTASGYLGLNRNLIDGRISMPGFNLLKIACSSNIFETVQTNGTVTFSNSGGTLELITLPNVTADSAILQYDKSSVSSKSHISTFRFDSIILASDDTALVGLSNGYGIGNPHVSIVTTNGGANWVFRSINSAGFANSSNITVSNNDIFTIYANTTRMILIKNNNTMTLFTSGVPYMPLGRYVEITSTTNNTQSSYIKLSYLS